MTLTDVLVCVMALLALVIISAFIYHVKQKKLYQNLHFLTGFSDAEIKDHLRDIDLSDKDLIYFVARLGRFPDHEESNYIQLFGLPAFMELKHKN